MLLAVPSSMMRFGLRTALDAEADITVAGEAATGDESVRAAKELDPDVVVCEPDFADMDGLDVVRAVRDGGRGLGAPGVVMIVPDGWQHPLQAVGAGVSGLLARDSRPEEAARAVRVLAGGNAFIAPEVTREVFGWMRNRPCPPGPELPPDLLTQREREILAHLADGMSNIEISKQLHIVEPTVKYHVSQLLRKLGLRDRLQAVVFAYQHDLFGRGAVQPCET
ncbi:LuxR C-terminal-related transcriptional regulator [Streptomyces sp. NPDC048182]|uniref:response regulator transcription factor n=1 Tax=unclassified Streptomyces TaxID=2593676 RepID=UPI0033B9D8AE